jgi:hypothetical protein
MPICQQRAMPTLDSFTRVEFRRFKAFRAFTLSMRHFNILVGPNNAGKSTILTAFRILAAALRKAEARKAEIVVGPNGSVYGHAVELASISVAEENIFHDYDDSEPASVCFHLSTGNSLTLFFPAEGGCFLLPDAQGRSINTPTHFRTQFSVQSALSRSSARSSTMSHCMKGRRRGLHCLTTERPVISETFGSITRRGFPYSAQLCRQPGRAWTFSFRKLTDPTRSPGFICIVRKTAYPVKYSGPALGFRSGAKCLPT